MMFRTGDVIAERYMLGALVGVGGMGTVYAARADGSDRELAIKLPHSVLARDPYVRRRFRDEVLAGSRIDHPNVVQIIEGGDSQGVPYVVMELVAGCPLSHVDLRRTTDGPTTALRLFLQVLDGIGAIHRARIVHGDIKSENVLVTTQRDGSAVLKLIDLGLARVVDPRRATPWDGVLAGTPGYLAPELLDGASPTYATDQYAAAIVLYELLAGALPSLDELASPSAITLAGRPCDTSVLRALDAALARALAHDPTVRFADVHAFAACVGALVPGTAAATPLLATDAPTGKWRIPPVPPPSRGSLPHG